METCGTVPECLWLFALPIGAFAVLVFAQIGITIAMWDHLHQTDEATRKDWRGVLWIQTFFFWILGLPLLIALFYLLGPVRRMRKAPDTPSLVRSLAAIGGAVLLATSTLTLVPLAWMRMNRHPDDHTMYVAIICVGSAVYAAICLAGRRASELRDQVFQFVILGMFFVVLAWLYDAHLSCDYRRAARSVLCRRGEWEQAFVVLSAGATAAVGLGLAILGFRERRGEGG